MWYRQLPLCFNTSLDHSDCFYHFAVFCKANNGGFSINCYVLTVVPFVIVIAGWRPCKFVKRRVATGVMYVNYVHNIQIYILCVCATIVIVVYISTINCATNYKKKKYIFRFLRSTAKKNVDCFLQCCQHCHQLQLCWQCGYRTETKYYI